MILILVALFSTLAGVALVGLLLGRRIVELGRERDALRRDRDEAKRLCTLLSCGTVTQFGPLKAYRGGKQ